MKITNKQKVKVYEQFLAELHHARVVTLDQERVVELLDNAHNLYTANRLLAEEVPPLKWRKSRQVEALELLNSRNGVPCPL